MLIFGHDVTNVTDDSRRVKDGSLFVAIKGENFDGEKAAAEAIAKNAAAVLSQTDLGLGDRQILVPNVRLAFAKAASEFYGNPTRRLKLIAVTGTNGKSTVATLIKHIIEGQGKVCGFIGTTGCDVGKGMTESALTTPKQDELYRLFAEMVENGVEFCVMETSSQALDQYRIADESFEVGIFTNLTQDHLDWHKTMENYYQAKKRLFTMCKSAIVCVDDDWGQRLANELDSLSAIPTTTYSVCEPVDFYAVNIKATPSTVSYWLSDTRSQKTFPVKCPMPGLFNVANSIAAIIACRNVGFDVQDSIEALAKSTGVRGRCEVIHSESPDHPFTVICDYAHTADALAKILTCVRAFAKRRVICVFGAAGERDADKRPAMGAVAAKHADFLVVTSDNPRFENPDDIIAEVVGGIPKRGKDSTPYKTFADRREAIEFALADARKDDIVLLAGKGHEKYQVIGDTEEPFDERTIVRETVGRGVLGTP